MDWQSRGPFHFGPSVACPVRDSAYRVLGPWVSSGHKDGVIQDWVPPKESHERKR